MSHKLEKQLSLLLTRLEQLLNALEAREQERERAKSIGEWCARRGISRSHFYQIGLPFSKSGSRSVPTAETDKAWLEHLKSKSGAAAKRGGDAD